MLVIYHRAASLSSQASSVDVCSIDNHQLHICSNTVPAHCFQLWSLTRRFKPVHLYTCMPIWVGHKWTLNL